MATKQTENTMQIENNESLLNKENTMQTEYDKSILNTVHGSSHLIPHQMYEGKNLPLEDLAKINHKYMGGGMSQNYFAMPVFEYYWDLHKFEYIAEIGTQKGALSVYFANFASITEQFFFDTFELYPDKDYYTREYEGCGHWLDKICEFSPYVNRYLVDVFSDDAMEHIKCNVKDKKTFIFCDGGDKAREFNTYAPLLKSGDCIAVHDWGNEINWGMISEVAEQNGIVPDEPFATSCMNLQTQIMPFRKA